MRLSDRGLNLLAILENASLSLDALRLNDLSVISFTLPNADPKNDLCEDRCFVEAFDGGESVGIFRITGSPDSDETAPGGLIRYEAEHAIATLLDDVFPMYTEYGGDDTSTAQTIRFVLSKQSNPRWQLGACAFNKAFEHKWEHDDLLTALFSVARPFEDYVWTYDFTTSPWTVNLLKLGTDPECELRFRRNMRGVSRTRDSKTFITKLYCLGYGEGVNQLSIGSVNGGLDYLVADTHDPDDPATGVFVDTSIEDPELLKSLGEEVLRRTKVPKYSCRISALDLYRLTGLEWDRLSIGKMLRVYDGRQRFEARIIEVTKPDPAGDPGNIGLTLANTEGDLSDSIGGLADRAKINLLASQGATNMYVQQFADNCDKDSPMKLRFFIPSNCARINRVLLSWDYEPFRAYSKSAASGGGKTTGSGGGDTSGASSSGLFTENSSQLITTKGTLDTAETQSSAAGLMTGSGGVVSTGNNTLITMGETSLTTDKAGTGATGASAGNTGTAGTGKTGAGTGHYHTITNHRHSYASGSAYTGYEQPGATTEASHTHNGPSHSHSVGSHTHSGPEHQHAIDKHYHSLSAHTHTGGGHQHELTQHRHGIVHDHYVEPHKHGIPQHTHSIDSHTHSIPDHAHGISYGIYEGPKVTAAALKVDGEAFVYGARSELDITAGLSVDDDGRIRRGAWHELTITPEPREGNADALTRITANLFVQTFIKSVGGGDH